MKKNFRILAVLLCMLAALCFSFAMAEEAGTVPDPTPTPMPTPGPQDLGALEFVIDGPDESMPITVRYSDFTDGRYSIENLLPGEYTITETDPDQLLTELNYTFDEENSVTSVTFEVKPLAPDTTADTVTAEETPAARLENYYVREVEVTPSPTPEAESDKIIIPVTKVWDDMGNRDGNRPNMVIVNLLADGGKVAQAVLNAGNGWSYTFTDLPSHAGGREIVYTVTEDPVPLYTTSIDGFVITNHYTPATTSATVSKVWADNNNSAGIRPLSIYCTLSNGMRVELNEGNGWTATIDNLPVSVGGREAVYTWSEQEVIGYQQTGADTSGNTTVFTNTLVHRGETPPPEGKNPPRQRRGENYLIIEDYGTPLGVEVIINHVGDCFD